MCDVIVGSPDNVGDEPRLTSGVKPDATDLGLCKEEDEAARRSRERGLKYAYKVSRSVCYAAVVDQVLELILDERKGVEEAEAELKLMLRGMWIPERPGRRNERRTTNSDRLNFQRYRKRIWA